MSLPIQSMYEYGIFTYIWLTFMVNVRYHTWMLWVISQKTSKVHEMFRKKMSLKVHTNFSACDMILTQPMDPEKKV